ncbi:hypothetical protein FKF97_10895 [Clostridium perfringens]|nr:hypothetical protein [Clostridium perfringens]
MINSISFSNLVNLGNGLWIIEEEEFFNSVKGLNISIKTLMYENQFNMDKKQRKISGNDFKLLIDGIISEEYYIEPYILIIYDTENLIVRLECYDTFEEEMVICEWEVEL